MDACGRNKRANVDEEIGQTKVDGWMDGWDGMDGLWVRWLVSWTMCCIQLNKTG